MALYGLNGLTLEHCVVIELFLDQFSSTISDPVSGAADDYWYSEGIKYSYTFELLPMTIQQGHFILPTSEIYPVAMEIIAGLKAFSELELDI